MDFDDVADELYAAPRDEFIQLRKRRADQVKKAGDKELAKRITALRKPSVAAAVVNGLARAHPDVVSELTELGTELREAHEALDGAALRDLSARRVSAVGQAMESARTVAESSGLGFGAATAEQVRATLDAVVTDPAVATAVASGCMATAATEAGSEAWLSVAPSPSAPVRPTQRGPSEQPRQGRSGQQRPGAGSADRRPSSGGESRRTPSDVDAQRRRHRESVELATKNVDQATRDVDAARDALADAQAEADAAKAAVAELRARLHAAERAEREVRERIDRARHDHERALRARHAAERELQRVRRL